MATTLRDLEIANTLIIKEHSSWVEQNSPSSMNVTNINREQYSILDYPELWSGARLFEASIEKRGRGSAASKVINDLINKKKKELRRDPEKIQELEEFKKNYENYFEFLKERCLILAILETLENINTTANNEFTKQRLKHAIGPSSLLKLQTHLDCLEAHKEISLLCSELRNKTDSSELEKIRQVEVLAKRLLDYHYEGAKKTTLDEIITQSIATIASLVGLLTGIPAAILGVAGIFFPPLLIPASILGTISFISYVSSAITARKVINEAIEYGRSPSPSDVVWLVIDTVFLPFNFFGGKIFSSVGHLVRPLKHLKELTKHIKTLWSDVITNVFPDTAETKEVIIDLYDVGSTLPKAGELKNTTTATSLQKIRSALAEHDSEAITKINNMKKEISQVNKLNTEFSKTTIHGRDFAFIKTTKEQEKDLQFTKSFHGHILLWDAGFLTIGKSKEAQNIEKAMSLYKELNPDVALAQRIKALETIQTQCEIYLTVYKDKQATKGRYGYVKNLFQHIKKELNNLRELNPKENSGLLVLVGFKAY